jgi:GABA(A) receptor-associated protein
MVYLSEFSFADRLAESSGVLAAFPTKVPVICERSAKAPVDCPVMRRRKFIVQRDYTCAQFLHVVRSLLDPIGLDVALFLFVQDRIIPPSGARIINIYNLFKSSDGFLYFTFSCEHCFG